MSTWFGFGFGFGSGSGFGFGFGLELGFGLLPYFLTHLLPYFLTASRLLAASTAALATASLGLSGGWTA